MEYLWIVILVFTRLAASVISQPECDASGQFLRHVTDSCSYYHCAHGRAHPKRCPSGLGVSGSFQSGFRNPCTVKRASCSDTDNPTSSKRKHSLKKLINIAPSPSSAPSHPHSLSFNSLLSHSPLRGPVVKETDQKQLQFYDQYSGYQDSAPHHNSYPGAHDSLYSDPHVPDHYVGSAFPHHSGTYNGESFPSQHNHQQTHQQEPYAYSETAGTAQHAPGFQRVEFLHESGYSNPFVQQQPPYSDYTASHIVNSNPTLTHYEGGDQGSQGNFNAYDTPYNGFNGNNQQNQINHFGQHSAQNNGQYDGYGHTQNTQSHNTHFGNGAGPSDNHHQLHYANEYAQKNYQNYHQQNSPPPNQYAHNSGQTFTQTSSHSNTQPAYDTGSHVHYEQHNAYTPPHDHYNADIGHQSQQSSSSTYTNTENHKQNQKQALAMLLPFLLKIVKAQKDNDHAFEAAPFIPHHTGLKPSKNRNSNQAFLNVINKRNDALTRFLQQQQKQHDPSYDVEYEFKPVSTGSGPTQQHYQAPYHTESAPSYNALASPPLPTNKEQTKLQILQKIVALLVKANHGKIPVPSFQNQLRNSYLKSLNGDPLPSPVPHLNLRNQVPQSPLLPLPQVPFLPPTLGAVQAGGGAQGRRRLVGARRRGPAQRRRSGRRRDGVTGKIADEQDGVPEAQQDYTNYEEYDSELQTDGEDIYSGSGTSGPRGKPILSRQNRVDSNETEADDSEDLTQLADVSQYQYNPDFAYETHLDPSFSPNYSYEEDTSSYNLNNSDNSNIESLSSDDSLQTTTPAAEALRDPFKENSDNATGIEYLTVIGDVVVEESPNDTEDVSDDLSDDNLLEESLSVNEKLLNRGSEDNLVPFLDMIQRPELRLRNIDDYVSAESNGGELSSGLDLNVQNAPGFQRSYLPSTSLNGQTQNEIQQTNNNELHPLESLEWSQIMESLNLDSEMQATLLQYLLQLNEMETQGTSQANNRQNPNLFTQSSAIHSTHEQNNNIDPTRERFVNAGQLPPGSQFQSNINSIDNNNFNYFSNFADGSTYSNIQGQNDNSDFKDTLQVLEHLYENFA